MRLARLSLLAVALLAFPAHPSAGAESTRKIPKTVGPCFSVHGRLFRANGTPGVRIWIVGTKKILGVVEHTNPAMPEDPILPVKITEILQRHQWDVFIYGDYMVCSVSRYRPGWMQFVYVKTGSNLVVEHR